MSVYYSAAKINLFLQVEGTLPNGYHELTSVMQSVSLFDCVEVLFGQEDYALDCGNLDLGPVEKNIVTRMWRLLKERFDLPGEIHVTLKKNIPVGAGLTGGSGNGAAVLKAVIDHFQLDLSKDEIVEITAKIGADVAFCYFGGTMLATGIGEKLKRLPAMPHWDILLFNGGFHVSTPEMFRAYDDIALGVEKVPVDMMVHALEKGSKEGILYSLYNGLEKVTYPRYASLRRLSDRLEDLFLPHLMSGSGPTVFALAEPKAAKNLLKDPEKELGKDFGNVYHAVPLGQGVFSEKEYACWVRNK
ncbi:MAG: 4-(cytidine 5'-diphospho)-2-C-methyl-D-erythritol kinase [Firmicutes bacterium]|nr:4-(cytidine 5'-diphospho)-2-C-methyl-D-erythritol kinase [Bacillota bacterium]